MPRSLAVRRLPLLSHLYYERHHVHTYWFTTACVRHLSGPWHSAQVYPLRWIPYLFVSSLYWTPQGMSHATPRRSDNASPGKDRGRLMTPYNRLHILAYGGIPRQVTKVSHDVRSRDIPRHFPWDIETKVASKFLVS